MAGLSRALAGAPPHSAGDQCDYTEGDDTYVGELVCSYGCWDEEDEACLSGLSNQDCAEIYGHVVWLEACSCFCRATVCTWGCLETDGTCSANVTEAECGVDAGSTWSACLCETLDDGQTVTESSDAAKSIYFSIPAFIVLFRESLEVVIVLVIILQFLSKVHERGDISDELFRRFKFEVYLGASLGFCICVVLGVGFLCLASLLYKQFKGDNRLIFEGIMMLVTCVVLSFLGLQFYKMTHSKEAHEKKFQERMEIAESEARRAAVASAKPDWGKKHGFFVLAFTTGLREGMESIVFLVGVISDVQDLKALPIPIITALIAARLCGCLFFQGTKRVNIERFMKGSAFLLLCIAAGFFSSSMHMFQELDVFGTWSPKEERPWQNDRVWDATDCCNDKTNRLFVLLRAMLGWQDQATPVELFAYAVYWILAVSIGVVMVAKVKREMAERFGGNQELTEIREEKLEASAEAI